MASRRARCFSSAVHSKASYRAADCAADLRGHAILADDARQMHF